MNPSRTARTPLVTAFLALGLWAVTVGWLVTRPVSSLSGPSDHSSKTSQTILRIINNDKIIRAGYVLNSPQVERDPKTGELSGYYIDLLREIARRSNARLELEETTFANMALAIDTRVQVVGGGGFVSIERATRLAFSDPVIYIGLGYVCRADDQRFHNEEDLHRPKIRVAFAAGSASEEYVKENLPAAEPVTLARGELARVALEVTSGRADVGIVNQGQCLQFVREQPGLRYPTRGKPFHLFVSSLTMRQGDPEGVAFFNTALRTLRTNGFFDKLEKKYNPEGLYWTPPRF